MLAIFSFLTLQPKNSNAASFSSRTIFLSSSTSVGITTVLKTYPDALGTVILSVLYLNIEIIKGIEIGKKQMDASGIAVLNVNVGIIKSVANPKGAIKAERSKNRSAWMRLRFNSDSRHHLKNRNRKVKIIIDR